MGKSNLLKISIIGLLFISSIGICQKVLEDPVQKYTSADFHSSILEQNHYVLFYIPWHGDTKSILPIWEELGQKYNSKADSEVKIVKVDCVQEKELCSHQDVSDSPTIKFYKVGGETTGVRYRGVRDFHSLDQFMNTILKRATEFVYGARVASPPPPQNGLHLLQDENFDEVVQNGRAFINFCTPWSTKCMDLEPIWKELAKEFQFDDDVLFGVVDCTHHKKTCNSNEVRGYPSLLWLEEGIVEEKYPTKERDINSLRTYVFKKLGKKEVKKANVLEEEPFKTTALQLDKNNFRSTIESSKAVFVNFLTPWCTPCQTLDPKYEELAQQFKDGSIAKIAKIDCTRNKAICDEEGVEEFPTLNLYRDGELAKVYVGPHKTADMTDFIKAMAVQEKEEL